MSRKNVDEALQEALGPLFPGCVFPNRYDGSELEYVVTSYETLPEVQGENGAGAAQHLVMVRYFLPAGQNPNEKKLQICSALIGHNFTTPSIIPAHDDLGQCWVFECRYVNGGVLYGFT